MVSPRKFKGKRFTSELYIAIRDTSVEYTFILGPKYFFFNVFFDRDVASKETEECLEKGKGRKRERAKRKKDEKERDMRKKERKGGEKNKGKIKEREREKNEKEKEKENLQKKV
ncbi:hypothetical protein RhiirA5_441803 [Rhizophagus irregularis]|uniref:Uncharacterized protein n=1 Tax=Rhizophagus irregularis TaxID=588596 RepID=A0A2N0NFA8_9GLOM|nr:hypothetical protein RhiirA5_441803 [Rhizophagus irregularis]